MLFHGVSALSGAKGPSEYDVQQDEPGNTQLFLSQLHTIQNIAYICKRLASPASNFLVPPISLTGVLFWEWLQGWVGKRHIEDVT